MISWLAKFRISSALDSGQAPPKHFRRKIAADAELQGFARRADALGRALASQTPPPADPALHNAIMRAVRETARRGQTRVAPVSFSLTAVSTVTAVVALAGVCLWLANHRAVPAGGPTLAGPGLVFEMSQQMPNAMSSAMLAPLTNEWELVDRDVQDTTQILLASFP
jgi:hypothetical protein